jgi:hypothetical protein
MCDEGLQRSSYLRSSFKSGDVLQPLEIGQ